MFRSKDEAAGYLAAAFDGEGSIKFGYATKDRTLHRNVLLSNTDFDLIEACTEAAALLGIPSRVYGPYDRGGKLFWHFAICGRAGFEVMLELVPLRIGRKRETLRKIVGSYRHARKPSREILESLYVFEGKSMSEIASLLGASSATVRRWIDGYEIPSRSRSDALRLSYAQGLRSDRRYAGCGCPADQRTRGCRTCSCRHWDREHSHALLN
jgi:hypothetical protein